MFIIFALKECAYSLRSYSNTTNELGWKHRPVHFMVNVGSPHLFAIN